MKSHLTKTNSESLTPDSKSVSWKPFPLRLHKNTLTNPRKITRSCVAACLAYLIFSPSSALFADTTITIVGDSSKPVTATVTVSGGLSTGIPETGIANQAVGVGLWFPQDAVGDTIHWYEVDPDTIDFANEEFSPSIDIPLPEVFVATFRDRFSGTSTANFDILRLRDVGVSGGDDWGLVANSALEMAPDLRTYSFTEATMSFTFSNPSGFNALKPGTYSRKMFIFGDVWTLHIIDLNGYQPDLSVNGEGLGIYGGCACAQTASLSSIRGRTVRGVLELDNASAESDSFLVNGSGGDRFFGVTYRDGSSNITADILTGNHDTGSIEGNGKATIDLEVKPNKRTLKKTTRKNRRKVTKWLKKSLLVSVGAESMMDGSKVDEAYFKISHR